MQKTGIKIISTGIYLPPKILTNFDLEKMVDTSDEWITTRTGIKERRITDNNTSTSDIAYLAAKNALEKINMSAEEIDTIIVATITPDMFFPSTACFVHKKFGITKPVVAFDIFAACSGFVYGLAVAEGLLRSGVSKKLLLIGAETLSKFTDWKDRNTCVLFGDGAGAMILSAEENVDNNAILSIYLGADGNYDELLSLPGGGSKIPPSYKTIDERLHYIKMSGKEVFKVAVTKMVESTIKCCDLAGIKITDLDLLIPHQANLRIINAVGERLGLPQDKVFINVHKYGNISAATVIIGLDEAIQEGKVKKGSLVGVVAFGGGFTWGSAVIRL